MANPTLAEQALTFVRSRPRKNPPDDAEIDVRVQGFCIEKKREGADLSTWDEDDWRDALRALGVEEFQIPSYLEDVSSWGVDD